MVSHNARDEMICILRTLAKYAYHMKYCNTMCNPELRCNCSGTSMKDCAIELVRDFSSGA